MEIINEIYAITLASLMTSHGSLYGLYWMELILNITHWYIFYALKIQMTKSPQLVSNL